MNCEQLRERLDAYMDGELSDVELREMEAHAATCEACGREFAAARIARELLGELPEEVPVPLSAQASWRRAVREEAARGRASEAKEAARRPRKVWLRAIYAAAAALVLVIGASAMLRSAPGATQVAPVNEEAALGAGAEVAPREALALPTRAVVASDGEIATGEAAQDGDYTAWKKYAAEDVDAACATVEALAEEYSGSCGTEKFAAQEDSGRQIAVCRVELPREYLDDFLSAVSHIGSERDSEIADTMGELAVVCIQIEEP